MTVEVEGLDAELAADQLWRAGATAILEGHHTLLAGFANAGVAAKAIASLRWPSSVTDVADPLGWAEAWKPYARATTAGRLVVHPPWIEPVLEDGQLAVSIDPGASFGHGAHPTTALLLDEVSRRVSGGERVLDVGCGSGVLGIAAAVCGSTRTVGIDIDPAAVEATITNAVVNNVEVEVSLTPLADVTGTFDIVFANMLAPALASLANDLRRVSAGGVLLVSGLLIGQSVPGLDIKPLDELDGWRSGFLRCDT